MFRYHRVRLVNLRLPHTVLLNSSVYFLLHDHFCLCLIDLIMIQTFLFVLSAALCLWFSIHTSLLVSLTSSRSRGTKKWWRDKCNFCIFVLIYSCLFISLFDFLIYYNLAIYMNKAVRSVECYLLPSCVFVNGATFEEKNELFFFSFCFGLNLTELCEHRQVTNSLFPDLSEEGKRTCGNSWKKLFTSNLRM